MVIFLIYSFDWNNLIKGYFTCFQNMSISKPNCQSGHLRKGLVFASHVLDYSSAVVLFFRRKWKGEESGFGKVVRLKAIVNDWRSNGWGCGETSIRAPENEVRIKANVYLRALFAFEALNGLIPSQHYIVTRKGFFLIPAGANGLSGKDIWSFFCDDVDILESTFVNGGPFDYSYCCSPPDAGKMQSTFLMSLCGVVQVFLPRCTFSPLHWLLWVTWPFPAILVTSFMIKKGQAMQG